MRVFGLRSSRRHALRIIVRNRWHVAVACYVQRMRLALVAGVASLQQAMGMVRPVGLLAAMPLALRAGTTGLYRSNTQTRIRRTLLVDWRRFE